MASRAKHANNKDMEAAVSRLSGQFLDCRDPGLRHAWKLVNNMHVVSQTMEGRRKLMHLGRTEECIRCGCIKEERFLYTKDGIEKQGQSYTYPEGYLMPGIPRGVKPSTIIYQEQFRRSMEEAARATPGQRETAER
jgi:hypothetical protein